MTTVDAPNVHNIAIEGSFDDAQAIVKAMFSDAEMRARFNLGAVNSINWARLMAQVVYYFYAAVRLGAPERNVAFSVPTGNFGDVFAGYVAAKMGLPIECLIVATNENDILYRALNRGDYSVNEVVATDSPSMDIQVSSNFERLLFDTGGRDGSALASQMGHFEADKKINLTVAQRNEAARLFRAARVTGVQMNNAMYKAFESSNVTIDPHTAIGFAAALEETGIDRKVPIVTLATAHPSKFTVAVENILGIKPDLPAHMRELFKLNEKYEILPATLSEIKLYLETHGTPA
jgi:threonine synthase